MAARSGMASLIAYLRELTGAGTASLTVDATTYWNDDHLQAALDRTREVIRFAQMQRTVTRTPGGSLAWYDYQAPARFFEQGTATFVVRDSTGSVRGTADYAADYESGRVVFTADTDGAEMFVDGHAYDPYAAAADVLDSWATHLARAYDFRQGDQSFSRSQQQEALRAQARAMRARARARTGRMTRSDEC